MPGKILVVDDEPDLELLVQQKFRKQIREKELEFIFANNGTEALKRLKKDGEIELVLTDINMPEMDGLTLLSKLSEIDKVLKSIIVSAYGDMQNIRTAMNRGAFDFVTKPIDLQDLETTIYKSLRELQLIKEALKSRDQLVSIQKELNIATQIQTSILPQTFPPFPDRKEFEIYAKMIPAREVGGDFYDFFFIDKNRLGFIIGDVSGKGVPAALLMATSRTLLKATAMKGAAPDKCLSEVNNLLVDESPSTMFVTAFYGVLNIRTGELEYCNGGHNPPFLISANGKVAALENVGGLFLSAVKDIPYQTQKIILKPNDTLFLYTDGVTEAEDAKENEFEDTRLSACLKRLTGSPLPELTQGVIDEVKAFSAEVPQTDDITCMALRYL
jgi:sigma-B regulation protein RsbU (phosphoserine phosphatase)